MNDADATNGQRAAVAWEAIGTYTRFEHPMEMRFLLFEGASEDEPPDPGLEGTRLAGLLSGLMHYAEQRKLPFGELLESARADYERQQTRWRPGEAVRIIPGEWPSQDIAGRDGEILKAQPGVPPTYLVDFMTTRIWMPETDLVAGQRFPGIETRFGSIVSAYAAQHCLKQIAYDIVLARREGRQPGRRLTGDVHPLLDTLAQWSGVPRQEVAQALGLDATLGDDAAGSIHPVALSAASASSQASIEIQAGKPTGQSVTARPGRPRPRRSRGGPQ